MRLPFSVKFRRSHSIIFLKNGVEVFYGDKSRLSGHFIDFHPGILPKQPGSLFHAVLLDMGGKGSFSVLWNRSLR